MKAIILVALFFAFTLNVCIAQTAEEEGTLPPEETDIPYTRIPHTAAPVVNPPTTNGSISTVTTLRTPNGMVLTTSGSGRIALTILPFLAITFMFV